MTTPGRRRACEACHVLKARCEPSNIADECERCVRLGKECIPAPRRLQRDRIAELEAQVEQLTKALQSQGLKEEPPKADAKKRKLSDGWTKPAEIPSGPALSHSTDVLEYLDTKLSRTFQQEVLVAYNTSVTRVAPFVQISEVDLDRLRSEAPLLLLSILAFPTTGVLESDLQHDLAERAIAGFQVQMLAAGERSLELVQSLLLAALWFRARAGFKHATVLQLIYLAVGMGADLGLGGPQASYDPGVAFDRMVGADSLESRRTWLACFVASSGMTTILRRPDSNPWTLYHNECLNAIRTLSSTPEDRLLCQIVRAEELCQRIVTRLELCDITRSWDLADYSTEILMSQLRTSVDDWATKLPTDLRPAELMFYHQIALIYLNEPVLHTQFNKSTFCPPLLAEKMTPSDFACPTVTVNHVASLYALKDACHVALDIATNLDAATVLNTPSLSYAPRILYSIFMLLKLYIAVTAHGNTYGMVLGRNELFIEHYLDRMKHLGNALLQVDTGTTKSFTTQIILASSRLADWYESYSRIIERYEESSSATGNNALPAVSGAIDAVSMPVGYDFGTKFYGDDDYMLSNLFTDEMIQTQPASR